MNIQPILDELADNAEECIAVALADAIFRLADDSDESQWHRELRLMEADQVRMRLKLNGFEIVKAGSAEST